MKKRIKGLLSALVLSVLALASGLSVNAKDVDDYGDISAYDWYYRYVADVASKDLMTGLDENTFGPFGKLSRGQFTTILYRMAGSPEVTYEPRFSDVHDGMFYSLPVTWANNMGIVTGYNETQFGTADDINREQLVTMLHRYAEKSGIDTSLQADYGRFPDGGKVSEYAGNAMRWAVGTGIISGNKDGTLAPKGGVSRAVCATIISRFTGGPSMPELTDEEKRELQINHILKNMPLEDKVSQLFFVKPEALTGADVVVNAAGDTKNALQSYPVGGVILFSQNIVEEGQLRGMLSNLRSFSKYPLFLGVDEEGGPLVARVANSGVIQVPMFPNMQEIGSTYQPERAYEVGAAIGGYLKNLGFNVDFAPVADVASNPANQVIGARSFGSDPWLVSQMVSKEVEGMQNQGVAAVLKHFPGHGDTNEDSHTQTAVLYKTADELRNSEFLPFKSGIEAGAAMVMSGHIAVPAVTGDNMPASLSEQMITGYLRNELGYDGIVITDSMSMGAIENEYGSGQAAVMAIQAGNDMILMPQDFFAARQAVLDAVHNNVITEQRLDESLLRIYRCSLHPIK